MNETRTMRPTSTMRLATSATRRMFPTRSSSVKPRSLDDLHDTSLVQQRFREVRTDESGTPEISALGICALRLDGDRCSRSPFAEVKGHCRPGHEGRVRHPSPSPSESTSSSRRTVSRDAVIRDGNSPRGARRNTFTGRTRGGAPRPLTERQSSPSSSSAHKRRLTTPASSRKSISLRAPAACQRSSQLSIQTGPSSAGSRSWK